MSREIRGGKINLMPSIQITRYCRHFITDATTQYRGAFSRLTDTSLLFLSGLSNRFPQLFLIFNCSSIHLLPLRSATQSSPAKWLLFQDFLQSFPA
jgi:hypothetical protein